MYTPRNILDLLPGVDIYSRVIRVSTGIPGYGLRMEMIRKFFPFPLWKRFRKSGIPERFPERFFFRKPEISGTLFRNSGSLRNSGTFRKFPERYGSYILYILCLFVCLFVSNKRQKSKRLNRSCPNFV